MLKLFVTDDALSINDGNIILSRWVCDASYGILSVGDAFGKNIIFHKVSESNPIETHNGIRTNANDVRADIGASFKSSFASMYLWLFTGRDSDIYQSGADYFYKDFGTGGNDWKIISG